MREKGIARKVETCSSSKTAFSEEDYLKISNRVREVINKLQDAFKTIQESTDPQIQAISQTKSTELQEKRQELERLEDMKDPKTVIAVVGATGEGKSSLINALLDQRNVLPTSGMRACTTVVVEVAQNVASDLFEADIEFRTKEEWIEECQCLTRDLTTDDGVLRTRSPDPGSDIFASYLKMMAVYGKIEENVIEERTDITEWLGRRKTITSSDPEDFRDEVEKYIIQSQDGEDDLQYWPIVKVVHLRVPNCDVCSTGAVLVDLPGVQDFNRARENVTKEYLKSCKAVWVVAGIHRAIDDKTARDLLGENFRRQLLMDGNYGNVAFICSKTDVVEPSECTRINKKLGNQPEIDKLNSEISDMEKEKRRLSREKRSYEKEEKEATKQIQQQKKLQENIKTEPRDDEKTTDMVNTPEQFAEQTEHLEEIHRKIHEHTNRMIEIEQEMAANRKKIKIICARARNTFAKEEIKKDFKAGLKELKHDENEEDEEDTDRNEDDILPVFCCSAFEYKKLLDPSSEDGPPMVFEEMGDTQVPQLRNYVHQVTREKKHQEMSMLVRLLRRFVLDLQNIISNASLEACLIPTYLACCKEEGHDMFQRVTDSFCTDIEAWKKTMFVTAVQNIVQALDALKAMIVKSVEVTRDGLQKDMKRYLEPMKDSTSDYGSLQSMLKSCVEILHETPWIQESHMETAGQTNAHKPDPPKADSSGIHKRKLDFVENLGNLKRQKRGTECSNPRDLAWVLDVSKADYENQLVIQQRLKQNCADYGLEFFGQTPPNGDCFFEAIASQMDRVGHPNSGQSGPLELRLLVSDYIRQNTSMQGPDGPVSLREYVVEPLEEYCERMSKSGTWADHVVVMAMAHMLQRDIVIVTSSPSTNGENCLLFVNGGESIDRVPLLLGHLWEYHYQSLQPMVDTK